MKAKRLMISGLILCMQSTLLQSTYSALAGAITAWYDPNHTEIAKLFQASGATKMSTSQQFIGALIPQENIDIASLTEKALRLGYICSVVPSDYLRELAAEQPITN